jgi:tetratricopeptide (TPR) repeat protein
MVNCHWKIQRGQRTYRKSRQNEQGIEFFKGQLGLFTKRVQYYFAKFRGSAPIFLLLLLYFVLPESPRWLIATGRYKEAKELIEKAAKINTVSNSLRANWGYSLNASNTFCKILSFLNCSFCFCSFILLSLNH